MKFYSFSLFILLAQFFGAHSQKKTESTRLTGIGKDVFKIPVTVLDQCFPYQEEKSFGFEFQFPPSGGECKNGLIICYPSLLATRKLENNHFMRESSINSKLFNIDIDYNNYILKRCDDIVKERERSITKYKSSVWHGISIEAIRDGEGELQMILDSSLIDQSYKILTIHRQFAIHFGTKNAISTYLTIDGGEPFHFDEEEGKFESFMEVTNGSALLLKDFVGFWTLGMDILPWEGDEQMELYVNRSCECTLEAWFVRPTDTELTSSVFTDEKGKVRVTQGPAKGYCNLTGHSVTQPINLEREQLMLIHLLTDEYIEEITFQVLEEDNQTQTFVTSFYFLLNTEFIIINLEGKNSEKVKQVALSKSNESRQIEFVFAFTNYSYGIQINGILLDDREFFPTEWWKGDYLNRSQNYKYTLDGQFLLLHQPFVMDFTTIEVNYKSPSFALPFFHSEPDVNKHSWATFHVEFFDPPENDFNISLLHDSPEHSEKVGATIMGMNVKPKDKQIDVIFWNCYKKLPGNENSCDGTETKSYKNENISKAAEFHIEVLSDSFSVIINGDEEEPLEYISTLPVWATNFFRVEGNVKVLGRPIWKEMKVYGDQKGFLHNFSIRLKSLLNYGDQINLRTLIIGSEKKFPKPFNITLLHEAAEWNEKIGDVILQLAFTFGDDSSPAKANQFVCRNFIHARKEWEELTKMPNRLNKFGQEFTMKITASKDKFDIEIEILIGMHEIECNYPILDKVQIPPWAIDTIRFDGDGFRVTDFNISHPSAKALIPNRINYVAKMKNEMKTGNSISITLTFTFNSTNQKQKKRVKSPLAVNLLNEGLSRHQKIGKTIIRLEFFPTGQIKDYYYTMEDKTEKQSPLCEQMAKWNSTLQDIFIQITVTKDESYEMTVNYKKCKTLHFNATLPPWALQYITIEFDEHKIDFSGEFAQHEIKCEPKNLCKMKQKDYDNYKTYLMEKERDPDL